jgi:hypothetical protein
MAKKKWRTVRCVFRVGEQVEVDILGMTYKVNVHAAPMGVLERMSTLTEVDTQGLTAIRVWHTDSDSVVHDNFDSDPSPADVVLSTIEEAVDSIFETLDDEYGITVDGLSGDEMYKMLAKYARRKRTYSEFRLTALKLALKPV